MQPPRWPPSLHLHAWWRQHGWTGVTGGTVRPHETPAFALAHAILSPSSPSGPPRPPRPGRPGRGPGDGRLQGGAQGERRGRVSAFLREKSVRESAAAARPGAPPQPSLSTFPCFIHSPGRARLHRLPHLPGVGQGPRRPHLHLARHPAGQRGRVPELCVRDPGRIVRQNGGQHKGSQKPDQAGH